MASHQSFSMIHRRKGIGGERRTVLHVLGGLAFAFDQQVGFADGIGFGLDFLSEQVNRHFLAMIAGKLIKRFLRNGEHAPGTARAVVNAVGGVPDAVGNGKKDQVGHEPDDIAGCEVLAGLLVVFLVKAPAQLFEDCSHGVIVQTG